MKKLLKAMLITAMLLSGCMKKSDSEDVQLNTYKAYYQVVQDNTSFIASSDYYDISAEMAKVGSTYRYYVFVDNPRIAMYSCKIMTIENDAPYSDQKVMPSVGITDTPNAMIPGQVLSESGYVKGLIASGEVSKPEVNLKIMVEWSDKNRSKINREFYSCIITTESVEFAGGLAQE